MGFVFLAAMSTEGPEIVVIHPEEALDEVTKEKISLNSFTISSGGGEFVYFRAGDYDVFTATFTVKRSKRYMIMSFGVASKSPISAKVKKKVRELVSKFDGKDYQELAQLVREMPKVYSML